MTGGLEGMREIRMVLTVASEVADKDADVSRLSKSQAAVDNSMDLPYICSIILCFQQV